MALVPYKPRQHKGFFYDHFESTLGEPKTNRKEKRRSKTEIIFVLLSVSLRVGIQIEPDPPRVQTKCEPGRKFKKDARIIFYFQNERRIS